MLHHTSTAAMQRMVPSALFICSTLQHAATHGSTLQHAATPQHSSSKLTDAFFTIHRPYPTLQHAAAHCNPLQHTRTAAVERLMPSLIFI